MDRGRESQSLLKDINKTPASQTHAVDHRSKWQRFLDNVHATLHDDAEVLYPDSPDRPIVLAKQKATPLSSGMTRPVPEVKPTGPGIYNWAKKNESTVEVPFDREDPETSDDSISS